VGFNIFVTFSHRDLKVSNSQAKID